MFRGTVLAMVLSTLLAWPATAQDSEKSDNLDVKSPVGDLHVGKDADAKKAGLPLYPRARPQRDQDNDPLNLGLFTESFGLKLIVAKYESDDPAEKVLAFYRDKMKKYGKVLECHTRGDNSGPVQELKVGTEGNARIVSIETRDSGKGTGFAIIYLHSRGKSGDI